LHIVVRGKNTSVGATYAVAQTVPMSCVGIIAPIDDIAKTKVDLLDIEVFNVEVDALIRRTIVCPCISRATAPNF